MRCRREVASGGCRSRSWFVFTYSVHSVLFWNQAVRAQCAPCAVSTKHLSCRRSRCLCLTLSISGLSGWPSLASGLALSRFSTAAGNRPVTGHFRCCTINVCRQIRPFFCSVSVQTCCKCAGLGKPGTVPGLTEPRASPARPPTSPRVCYVASAPNRLWDARWLRTVEGDVFDFPFHLDA